jgi:hypothetical protein
MRSGPRGGTGRRRDENVRPCRYPTVRGGRRLAGEAARNYASLVLAFRRGGGAHAHPRPLWPCTSSTRVVRPGHRLRRRQHDGHTHAGKAIAALSDQCGELPDYFEVVGRGQPLHCRAAPRLFPFRRSVTCVRSSRGRRAYACTTGSFVPFLQVTAA